MDDKFWLFVDGVSIPDAENGVWNNVITVTIPGDAQVFAVKAENAETNDGIIASLDNGVITNSSWKCTGTPETGWNKVGFDDSQWPAAAVVASNGEAPWGLLPGISSAAKRIWTVNHYNTSGNNQDMTVYCRTTIFKGLVKLNNIF